VSYAQCPICSLRFRFQSELEAHAHDDHCLPSEVHLAKHTEPKHRYGYVRDPSEPDPIAKY